MTDMEVELVSESGTPVPVGEVGEISLRSRYLALGYWRNQELSDRKFVPDPNHVGERTYRTGDLGRFQLGGCLEYLGRGDFQLKIRGQRVETAAVEQALREAGPAEAAVVATSLATDGEPMLVAYLTPRTTPPRDPARLRAELRQRFPEFMIPTAIIELDVLPLNANGKVDRRALPALATAPRAEPPAPPAAPPRDDCERRLVALWEAVLGRGPIGVDESFFEIGGDSLRAVQLAQRIGQDFECEFTPAMLMRAQTVEVCARYLRPD